MKNVLVTGVSTGIGLAIAESFLYNGYRVFGSVRKQSDADRVSEKLGEHFFPLLFDITDEAAILNAKSDMEAKLNGEGFIQLQAAPV